MSVKLYKTLHEQLYKWYLEQKTLGITITNKLLRQEANKITKTVGGPSNIGKFMQQFKKRYNIVLDIEKRDDIVLDIEKRDDIVLKSSGCKFKKLDEQLYEWCLEQKTLGATITEQLLCQKAYEIADKVREEPLDMRSFLRYFKKRYHIELEFQDMSGRIKHKRFDKQLYEWCLEQKTSGDTITEKLLRQEAYAIAEKVGEEPSDMYAFLQRFKERYDIVLEFQYMSGRFKYKRLDEKLYEWCQERQATRDTITKTLLRQKAFEIAKKLERRPSNIYLFLQKFIKHHRILLESRNTTEILQNPVQRDDEANQSDPEKFIQEFSQRLEKENINRDNIYIMIKTDLIWRLLFQTMLGYVDLTRVTIQVTDDYYKKIRNTPFIFCTNVTGSNKLPPFFGALENKYENQSVSEHCESKLPVAHKLRENVSTKESENFAWWYNNVFKKFVKYHQKEKNIIGKVLLLVDNCTRCILSEEITQDDRFEVLFPPKNRVSFFDELYSDIIWYMEKSFRTYTLERSQNFSSEGEEFNINTHWITNVIYDSWIEAADRIEKVWRKFLEQDQTREGIPILTSVSSQELLNSTGKDIVPDEIPEMYISFAEVEKKEHQEQEKSIEGTENIRESRKRRHAEISVVNSEEIINISEEDLKQIVSNDISDEVLSFFDGEIEEEEL